ncbi:hypothetical protein ACAG96_06865 [Candidatus Izemoplasma sp. B36]|uniref:hypothetical protein n=1 Tax=Candidatus Izemoplasma sp. B36 TaxID=3242468 RepID=UPI003555F36F
MKSKIIKTLVFVGLAITAITTVSLTSVNAQSVYEEYSLETEVPEAGEYVYTLEEMLTYAIMDEYMAQAEYEAIINEFGEIKPFINIVNAEVTHINLLLPLFETYGFVVPENNAIENVVIPESITSALSTGIEAEEANIAMYELFLAQDNLPDDVRVAFEYLLNASQNHLAAFSNDHFAYYGTDLANKIQNQWRKAFGNQNQSQSKGSNGNQYKGSNGSQAGDGTCNNQ